MRTDTSDSGLHSSGARQIRARDVTAAPRFARPSISGFMTAASAIAAALFFLLWWMLQSEEAPWVPAGLAASVVILVAAVAGLLVVRRARVQHYAAMNEMAAQHSVRRTSSKAMRSPASHASALRALQRQSAQADARDSPELHRELYDFCSEYLIGADKALQYPGTQPDGRIALKAGKDRVRELQKHHLLTWARGSARTLTHEAQQRVRLFEKIETANRALDCIDKALKIYPDEDELNVSARAVREFITSSRVAHWVELAERAAFKGHYQRAIDCYRDALYYLTRETPDATGEAAAERVSREIELLRARLDTEQSIGVPPSAKKTKRGR